MTITTSWPVIEGRQRADGSGDVCFYRVEHLKHYLSAIAEYSEIANVVAANGGEIDDVTFKQFIANRMDRKVDSFPHPEEPDAAEVAVQTIMVDGRLFDRKAVDLLVVALECSGLLAARFSHRSKIGAATLKRFAKARDELDTHLGQVEPIADDKPATPTPEVIAYGAAKQIARAYGYDVGDRWGGTQPIPARASTFRSSCILKRRWPTVA